MLFIQEICNEQSRRRKDLYFNEQKRLTEYEASGMTVNERLFALGLLSDFDNAVVDGNKDEMTKILKKVYLTPDDITKIIEHISKRP